jgi:hypothetical protein
MGRSAARRRVLVAMHVRMHDETDKYRADVVTPGSSSSPACQWSYSA